jgi:hypothetical protein
MEPQYNRTWQTVMSGRRKLMCLIRRSLRIGFVKLILHTSLSLYLEQHTVPLGWWYNVYPIQVVRLIYMKFHDSSNFCDNGPFIIPILSGQFPLS